MTRRRNLEAQLHGLDEIRAIMDSMKVLAHMELRKLARFLDAQQAVVEGIEQAARDLLGSYPGILPPAQAPATLYILIGTERGFCGGFNHALLEALETAPGEGAPARPRLLGIGRKLHTLLEDDPRVAALLDGAGVVEEVSAVIDRAVAALNDLQAQYGAAGVCCLYHDQAGAPVMRALLPPFQELAQRAPRLAQAPVLNESPRRLLAGLTDHYLLAALQRMLYTSLMVENRQRVAHLEGAVRHLEEQAGGLQRQCNQLRQEEIIEEIEVLLLNSAEGAEPRY